MRLKNFFKNSVFFHRTSAILARCQCLVYGHFLAGFAVVVAVFLKGWILSALSTTLFLKKKWGQKGGQVTTLEVFCLGGH